MQVIKARFEVLAKLLDDKLLETCGRTCYKSESRITEDSSIAFAQMLLTKDHHAMVEFGGWMVVKFVCNRGVSHELVRHRLFSFAQESTRYCNYSKNKFGRAVGFIDPRPHVTDRQFINWLDDMQDAERRYFRRLAAGESAQMARGSLPIDIKTEVCVGGNIREWRHFFSLRAAKPAHPQMRDLACSLLRYIRCIAPVFFDDVGDSEADDHTGTRSRTA